MGHKVVLSVVIIIYCGETKVMTNEKHRVITSSLSSYSSAREYRKHRLSEQSTQVFSPCSTIEKKLDTCQLV